MRLTIFNLFVLIGLFPVIITFFTIKDLAKGGIVIQNGTIDSIKGVNCRGDCPSVSIRVKTNKTNEMVYILEYPSNLNKIGISANYEHLLNCRS